MKLHQLLLTLLGILIISIVVFAETQTPQNYVSWGIGKDKYWVAVPVFNKIVAFNYSNFIFKFLRVNTTCIYLISIDKTGNPVEIKLNLYFRNGSLIVSQYKIKGSMYYCNKTLANYTDLIFVFVYPPNCNELECALGPVALALVQPISVPKDLVSYIPLILLAIWTVLVGRNSLREMGLGMIVFGIFGVLLCQYLGYMNIALITANAIFTIVGFIFIFLAERYKS